MKIDWLIIVLTGKVLLDADGEQALGAGSQLGAVQAMQDAPRGTVPLIHHTACTPSTSTHSSIAQRRQAGLSHLMKRF